MENQQHTTNPVGSTGAPAPGASSFGSNVNTNEFPPPPQRQAGTAPPPPPRTDAATARESPSGQHSGSNIMHKAKGVLAQGHGLGENIRGNFNAAVDTAFNDKQGQAKDEAVASKGAHEVINKDFAHDKKPPKLA
ncbi:hypothetical protein LIA77_09043 [Sarocladium implicatum]|nr:hypothetical protein LIA77_09043 [Sarocladium implicatum]